MAFRADESASRGFESVKSYLVPRNIDAKERARSERELFNIVERYGPVVEGYPAWHPLITHHDDQSSVIYTIRTTRVVLFFPNVAHWVTVVHIWLSFVISNFKLYYFSTFT